MIGRLSRDANPLCWFSEMPRLLQVRDWGPDYAVHTLFNPTVVSVWWLEKFPRFPLFSLQPSQPCLIPVRSPGGGQVCSVTKVSCTLHYPRTLNIRQPTSPSAITNSFLTGRACSWSYHFGVLSRGLGIQYCPSREGLYRGIEMNM